MPSWSGTAGLTKIPTVIPHLLFVSGGSARLQPRVRPAVAGGGGVSWWEHPRRTASFRDGAGLKETGASPAGSQDPSQQEKPGRHPQIPSPQLRVRATPPHHTSRDQLCSVTRARARAPPPPSPLLPLRRMGGCWEQPVLPTTPPPPPAPPPATSTWCPSPARGRVTQVPPARRVLCRPVLTILSLFLFHPLPPVAASVQAAPRTLNQPPSAPPSWAPTRNTLVWKCTAATRRPPPGVPPEPYRLGPVVHPTNEDRKGETPLTWLINEAGIPPPQPVIPSLSPTATPPPPPPPTGTTSVVSRPGTRGGKKAPRLRVHRHQPPPGAACGRPQLVGAAAAGGRHPQDQPATARVGAGSGL